MKAQDNTMQHEDKYTLKFIHDPYWTMKEAKR